MSPVTAGVVARNAGSAGASLAASIGRRGTRSSKIGRVSVFARREMMEERDDDEKVIWQAQSGSWEGRSLLVSCVELKAESRCVPVNQRLLVAGPDHRCGAVVDVQ